MQRDWLKALRHSIAFTKCKRDPTIGIKIGKPAKSDGHLTWGNPQIERYRERYALGTMARLAIELVLNIAARRNDAYRIGRPHMSFNVEKQFSELTWRPTKTKKLLTVPVLPELQTALDAMPQSDALTFLLTEHGGRSNRRRRSATVCRLGEGRQDWSPSNVMTARCAAIALTDCERPPAREWRRGCKAIQIMEVSGHKTLAEAQKYIDAVDQERMAEDGDGQGVPDQNEHRQ